LVAVDHILSLTRFVVDNNMLDKLGGPFAFILWVSACLLLVHGSTISHTLSPNIVFLVDTLRRMGKYWKIAEQYGSVLRRVLDEYAEYEQSVGTETDSVAPSSVKVLAEMRRRAFDLDFLISRQPRSSINTRHPAATSARDPARNELDYLDAFGFFNVPRIPAAPYRVQLDGTMSHADGGSGDSGVRNLSVSGLDGSTVGPMPIEFNITNYLMPTPETDWLFRSST
jgi:hypothetical protein